jgi:hypothetical protein
LTNASSSIERLDGGRLRAALSPLRDTDNSSHIIVVE